MAMTVQDRENVMMHLREHTKYPATRDQLVKECNSLSDFSDEDKKWFSDNLPAGTYRSAEEVARALKM